MTEEEAETPTRRTEKEKRSYSIFMKALRTAHSIASQEVRRKWKNLITMVRMVNGFLWEFTRRSRIKDPILSPFLDFETQESRRRMDIALMKPKAVTEVSPNSNAVLMLCKPHYARTEDEIETVLTNLRYLKGFCSFTEDIQVKLAKYGRHMEVGANRVIVRQGQDPRFWYFVITGQALATEISENNKSISNVISQGDTFVEGDFEKGCPRSCSVMSRRNMQLLVISKKHYWHVFHDTSLQDKYPDHLEFIRHMDFMKFWPCDMLLKYPSQCYQKYFKNDVVLCTDSAKSNHIYIVRTGTCVVYKFVEAVKHHGRT
ncbi:rap guanine nucleotide exchange factor 1-like isoform X2 [Pomacea canaliculata]|nr:rap guanine nucleotide exchange factor 1-like isoform X2 [Pomacea canaliculata]